MPLSTESHLFSLIKRAADEGDAQAMYVLALFYLMGLGVASDVEQFTKWILTAAKNGVAQSEEFFWGHLLEGCEWDEQKARSVIRVISESAKLSIEVYDADPCWSALVGHCYVMRNDPDDDSNSAWYYMNSEEHALEHFPRKLAEGLAAIFVTRQEDRFPQTVEVLRELVDRNEDLRIEACTTMAEPPGDGRWAPRLDIAVQWLDEMRAMGCERAKLLKALIEIGFYRERQEGSRTIDRGVLGSVVRSGILPSMDRDLQDKLRRALGKLSFVGCLQCRKWKKFDAEGPTVECGACQKALCVQSNAL
jgi:hypothetical protein